MVAKNQRMDINQGVVMSDNMVLTGHHYTLVVLIVAANKDHICIQLNTASICL